MCWEGITSSPVSPASPDDFMKTIGPNRSDPSPYGFNKIGGKKLVLDSNGSDQFRWKPIQIYMRN